MDRFQILGGRSLRGTVAVRPAKNALLPCLAAGLLTSDPVVFEETADLQDIHSMVGLLRHLGSEVEGVPGGAVRVRTPDVVEPEAPYDLVRRMRASILVLGPLLARFGRARVSLPGGCAIGARPIDLHIRGLETLGARITVDHGYVRASAERLRGSEILFDKVTVGGTENLIMAAVLARGETVLRNAAREPEIADLCRLLTAMGARIEGAGTHTVKISGVEELGGAIHTCIPDRIETGTLAAAAVVTGGDVELAGVVPEHVEAFLGKLRSMGIQIETGERRIRVRGAAGIRSADITTQPYPGYPTDLQAQFMALLTRASGSGAVRETIFENRFMHVPELQRMGADIRIEGNVAVVRGPTPLSGAPVMASDLRASAGLLLAALCAEGSTEIHRIYHLDRGYERLDERLNALGARIHRVRE